MTILDRIRAALAPHREVSEEVEHQLRLATGALLLEMCRADFQTVYDERVSIAEAIRDGFGLSAEETRELLEAAEEDSEAAVSIAIYTSLIKEYATAPRQRRLIRDLWRVAYADGELHALEEQLVLRVGELLDIPPRLLRSIQLEVTPGAD